MGIGNRLWAKSQAINASVAPKRKTGSRLEKLGTLCAAFEEAFDTQTQPAPKTGLGGKK